METDFISSFTNSQTRYPDFLLKKLDDFYTNRIKEWNGKHILRVAPPDETSINLTSNDYLQFSTASEVFNAQIKTIDKVSLSPLMSASFIHGETPQTLLEKRMAAFFEAESAILCQSGYAANLGLMQTLLENTEIPVYIDMMTHMSIWNGIRLGGGKAIPFPHNDLNSLKKKVDDYGSGIIVVDSIYSSDGSIAPLQDLAQIAKSKKCLLIVDESHSFGTHGPDGRGLVVGLGINEMVLFRTASLAKTFGSRAGLILCPLDFGDYFCISSKPQIFSSALMPFDIAGLDAILSLINSKIGSERRLKLTQNWIKLKNLLLEANINVNECESQIIALKTNSERDMMLLKESLEKERIFGAPFCYPATPKKKPLVRLSLHSELQPDELDYIAFHSKKSYANLKF